MRVTLIHNEGAGDDDQATAEELRTLIRDAGHEVSYRSSQEDDLAAALREPADVIAAAGGDGTISAVAKRMAGSNVPLAVLPMGTANNISHTLGIADIPLDQLITGWQQARVVAFDLGVARGPWGTRRFVEGIGAGVFAWTLPAADASGTLANLTDADSKIVYALQMLKDRLEGCPPVTVSAKLDGRDVTGEYVLFEAMNMRYIGPNLYLAPHGEPGDGQLDVVMVSVAERERLIAYLSSWQNGEERRAALPTRRGRHLVMQWTGFHVHVDDDIWPEEGMKADAPAQIEVTLEPQVLRVLVPNVKDGESLP
jgi:diacylglycerol kinase family enzyme